MNWGLKIILGLGTFIVFICGAGIYMVSKNTDSLEDEDYYERSLAYDEVYQRKQNLLKDEARPMVAVKNDTLYISFRQLGNQGELVFKRPSDSRLDVTLPFATKSTHYSLPVASFAKGSWRLEILWRQSDTPYISDHNLYF